jgi:hypothetical protein
MFFPGDTEGRIFNITLVGCKGARHKYHDVPTCETGYLSLEFSVTITYNDPALVTELPCPCISHYMAQAICLIFIFSNSFLSPPVSPSFKMNSYKEIKSKVWFYVLKKEI